MKRRLLFFVLYGLFWLLFFLISKLLFLVYQNDLSGEYTVGIWLKILIHGLKLDLSMTAYLLVIPFLSSIAHSFIPGNWFKTAIRLYTLVFLIIISLMVVVDMELYTHWGFRLDKTPLMYLKTPKEMMASTTLWTTIRQL